MKKHLLVLLAVGGLWAGLVLVSRGQAPAQALRQQPGGQQEKVAEADIVLRISVNLVQVDAVVTDSKGNQVTDLKPQDFIVLQDGKPQKITHFSYIRVGEKRAAQPAARRPVPQGGMDKLAPPPPPTRLRPEQVRRTIALVVDDLGLSWESITFVRSALKKFVDTQMQPGDLVAIIRTGAGMGALQAFSSDKRQLYAAIDKVKFNFMGRAGIAAFAPISASSEAAAGEATMGETESEFRERIYSVGTLGAVNFLVSGLKELPGRKSIVLFSDNLRILNRQGFNSEIIDALRNLTDQANRAGVVIYAIDPRGLPTLSLTAADDVGGMRGDQVTERLQQRRDDHFDSQAGSYYLTEQTGGFFITNNNDLNWGLQRVLDDQDGYYLIGYTPDRSTFDEKTGRRHFYKVTVRVTKPGLRVRSRTGFYGIPDQGARQVYQTREEQMLHALSSPFGSAAIRLRLTPLFGYDPDPKKGGAFVVAMLHIDCSDLTFTEEPYEEPAPKPGQKPEPKPEQQQGEKPPPEPWHKTVLDVMVITFGDNGQITDQRSGTYTIRVRGKEYDSVRLYGLIYHVSHLVKKAGAYQLRVAVRDAGSQRIGSASQFIEIPDVKKGKLLLTGIMMRSMPPGLTLARPAGAATPGSPAAGAATAGAGAAAPSAATAAAGAEAIKEGHSVEADPMGSPAVRIFKPGRSILYASQILNAHLDNSKHPQLESQLRLFHGGQQIYAGKVSPVDASSQPLIHRLITGGELRLARAMEPGDYTLQIIVTDKLVSEKNRTASQWMDFQVAK